MPFALGIDRVTPGRERPYSHFQSARPNIVRTFHARASLRNQGRFDDRGASKIHPYLMTLTIAPPDPRSQGDDTRTPTIAVRSIVRPVEQYYVSTLELNLATE